MDRRKEKQDMELDRLLQESFGLNDAGILEQQRRADEKVDDSEVLPPEDWDRQLIRRLGRERKRTGIPIRAWIAAAVVLMVFLSAGMAAIGRKSYECRNGIVDHLGNAVVMAYSCTEGAERDN